MNCELCLKLVCISIGIVARACECMCVCTRTRVPVYIFARLSNSIFPDAEVIWQQGIVQLHIRGSQSLHNLSKCERTWVMRQRKGQKIGATFPRSLGVRHSKSSAEVVDQASARFARFCLSPHFCLHSWFYPGYHCGLPSSSTHPDRRYCFMFSPLLFSLPGARNGCWVPLVLASTSHT